MAIRIDHTKLRKAILSKLERMNLSTTEIYVALQGFAAKWTRNGIKTELLALEDERIIKRVGRNAGLKWELKRRQQ